MFVEARCTDLILAPANSNSPRNYDGIPKEQVWQLQPQRPGSGVLDVECLHRGPTLVTIVLYFCLYFDLYFLFYYSMKNIYF